GRPAPPPPRVPAAGAPGPQGQTAAAAAAVAEGGAGEDAPSPPDSAGNGRAVLEGRDLFYRPPGRREWVLRGASVRLRPGDRVLVQGPSGGGKSMWAAVLAGH